MQESNTNQIIQGKATFKKDINENLIHSEVIRATLNQDWWWIRN
jgi:hypothetical protein